MTQEDEKLLLKDSCVRLPYGICANLPNHHLVSHEYYINDINVKNGWTNGILNCLGKNKVYAARIEDIRPYLRSMSSMTEEEFKHFMGLRGRNLSHYGIKQMMKETFNVINSISIVVNLNKYLQNIDWLLSKHFDVYGLIEKGLAIEVTEYNNPYEEH